MKFQLLLAFILLTSRTTFGQPAPDFTVTDSDGQVHHLYADYLDQGKTVMIKIFFTTCPPCQSIAPLMEPFYQEWGAGQYDVEFFELSDKSFDTDALVNGYKVQFGETFPGVGVAGGSLAAVAPYKNGMYGPWFGTPTFVVIAPDGTVQYDVSGNGNQATIDAVDAAIAATGAVKPGGTPLAPDFTVTDTDDNDHTLYADYLDQGKTVVLEIFNSSCSACNSIAPLLQPLYEEWGNGEADVEFFAMTDLFGDTDPDVSSYQNTYGQTFPGISSEGGSLPAVAPYKDGTFGPWTDTPMFVVIAPDGTVQYNVEGATDNETIEAIDEAITATGAVKPPPGEEPVSVSGQITFMMGSTGVGNTFVQVVNGQGDIVASDTTSIHGTFDLSILLSEVQPDWQLRAVKTGSPLNGVNALDLVRTQKHLLGIELFDTPTAKIAADANESGTISTLDLVLISRILLGMIPHFPDQQSWTLIPADTDFGVPTQHPPVITSYTIPLQDILSGARLPNFIAIKKGDATGNANLN
jgi:thiol-disulfide isomerase/thioredoxin